MNLMLIAAIPTAELRADLAESIEDIAICEQALRIGITHHRDGLPVQDRIQGNRRIIAKIKAELNRRGEGHGSAR